MPLPDSEQSMKQGPMRKGSSNDFQTPKEALWPLLPYLPKHWTVWECAVGDGNLGREFNRRGYTTIFSDILSEPSRDFLKWTPPLEYDCIVTNPPFSLKQEFLERCYSLGKPFALLLPLTTFETPKRQALFKKYGVQVIFFDKRINFTTPSGSGSGSWFATAWFTWGLNLPKDLNFVMFKDIRQVPIDEMDK